MRDLSANELADIVRKKFLDRGIKLPKRTVQGLTNQFFKRVETLMEKDKVKLVIWNGAITNIYKFPPESGGEDDLQDLLSKRKLQSGVWYILKKKEREARAMDSKRQERTESETVHSEGFWEEW